MEVLHARLRPDAARDAEDTPPAPSSATGFGAPATVLSRRKRLREDADDYRHIIVQIDDRRRVIDCQDHIQWIVQLWNGGRWRGRSYCRTREALIRCSNAKGDSLAIIRALPEWHP